jgi:hypothetical protein
MASSRNLTLQSLPGDILIMLPEYLHNIEDYMNLSSTCRVLRNTMSNPRPNILLRLATVSSRIFFRPSPHFLLAATGRELGNWARLSDANEQEFVGNLSLGVEHLMELALQHCGITMERIRKLHSLRFSTINPVVDIIDKCVGQQWHALPDFWNTDDAYTIDSDPPESFFHLAIYGELFGPDFEPFLTGDFTKRRLKVETRLEYVKYCIPDFATDCWNKARDIEMEDGTKDPRRVVIYHPNGPYATGAANIHNNNIALKWIMKSTRWRPHWKEARVRVSAEPDFTEDLYDDWYDITDWRQGMWETVMVCQGLEGLGMVVSAFTEDWAEKIKEWRDKISKLEKEPAIVRVGTQHTHEFPDIYGDLCICSSGYVVGS